MTGLSIGELGSRAADDPEDGMKAFEYASALDRADREAEAIPVYRRALADGLPGETEYRARVQLERVSLMSFSVDDGGCEEDTAEEGAGVFVVPGGDTAPLF